MRYRLRTLLIVLALGPPVLAAVWWYGSGFFAVLLDVAVFGLVAILVLLATATLIQGGSHR